MTNCGKKLQLRLWLKLYRFRTMRNHRLFILGLYSICGCGNIRYEILGLGLGDENDVEVVRNGR